MMIIIGMIMKIMIISMIEVLVSNLGSGTVRPDRIPMIFCRPFRKIRHRRTCLMLGHKWLAINLF